MWRILLCGFLFFAAPAQAEIKYPIDVKGWTGGAVYTDSGDFSGCYAGAYFNSGISLYFGTDYVGSFTIWLQKDSWSLGTTKYQFTINVDERVSRSVQGEGDGDSIWIDLGPDEAFYRAVQEGSLLHVDGAETLSFELVGTKAALNQIAACGYKIAGTSPIGDPFAVTESPPPAGEEENPFGDQEATAPDEDNEAQPDVREVFEPDEIYELLDQAEFPKPALVEEQRLTLFGAEVPFMGWASEDEELPLYGFLLYLEDVDSARAAVRKIGNALVDECSGKTALGLDEVVDRAGTVVTGGRVLCEDADGKTNITFLAATKKQRGVFLFAHVAEPTTQNMARSINDALKEALLGFSY